MSLITTQELRVTTHYDAFTLAADPTSKPDCLDKLAAALRRHIHVPGHVHDPDHHHDPAAGVEWRGVVRKVSKHMGSARPRRAEVAQQCLNFYVSLDADTSRREKPKRTVELGKVQTVEPAVVRVTTVYGDQFLLKTQEGLKTPDGPVGNLASCLQAAAAAATRPREPPPPEPAAVPTEPELGPTAEQELSRVLVAIRRAINLRPGQSLSHVRAVVSVAKPMAKPAVAEEPVGHLEGATVEERKRIAGSPLLPSDGSYRCMVSRDDLRPGTAGYDCFRWTLQAAALAGCSCWLLLAAAFFCPTSDT